MLCIISEISLMPDWTFIVQLAIFLFVIAILTIFVIRPIIRIIDRRKAFTTDASLEAEHLTDKAIQLETGKREVLTMSLNEAYEELKKRTTEARRTGDAVIADAKTKTSEIYKASTTSLEKAEKSVEKEIDERAQGLVDEIVSRIVEAQ